MWIHYYYGIFILLHYNLLQFECKPYISSKKDIIDHYNLKSIDSNTNDEEIIDEDLRKYFQPEDTLKKKEDKKPPTKQDQTKDDEKDKKESEDTEQDKDETGEQTGLGGNELSSAENGRPCGGGYIISYTINSDNDDNTDNNNDKQNENQGGHHSEREDILNLNDLEDINDHPQYSWLDRFFSRRKPFQSHRRNRKPWYARDPDDYFWYFD